jgi:hypothetical protein
MLFQKILILNFISDINTVFMHKAYRLLFGQSGDIRLVAV